MVGFSIASSRVIRPGVEGHGKALPGPLGVPHHGRSADPRARRRAGGSVEFRSRMSPRSRAALRECVSSTPILHCMELVVSRHLLDEVAAAVVLEDDEVANEGEEPLWCEHAFEHHLELRYGRLCFSLVRDGTPGLEPLLPRGEGADAGLEAV